MKRTPFVILAALVLLAGCSKPTTDATPGATQEGAKSAATAPSASSVTAPGPPPSAIESPKPPAEVAAKAGVPAPPAEAGAPAGPSKAAPAIPAEQAKLSAVTSAPTGGSPTGKAYTLRVNEKAGAKHTYAIAMDVEMKINIPAEQLRNMKPEQAAMMKGKQGFAFKGKINSNVTKAGGGQFTYRMETKIQQFKASGMFEKMADVMKSGMTAPQQVTVDALGNPISQGPVAKGNPPSGSAGSNYATNAIAFPKEPVRVGAEWDTKMNLGVTSGMQMKAKFVKVESLKGREAAKLQYTVSAVPGMSMSGPLFVWVDLANGNVLKLDADLKMKQGEQGSGSIRIRQDMVK